MKRSEAIKKLMPKCVSRFEILKQENYANGEYHRRAEELLDFIEKELGMQPPNITKMPDTWFRSTGDYGYEAAEWEYEDEKK